MSIKNSNKGKENVWEKREEQWVCHVNWSISSGYIWSLTRNTDATSWWELVERYRFRSWLCRDEAQVRWSRLNHLGRTTWWEKRRFKGETSYNTYIWRIRSWTKFKKKDESSEIRGKKQSILILNKEASMNVRGISRDTRYKKFSEIE